MTGLFATEYFHVKYPQLHPSAFEKTLSAFIGSKSFAQIATEVGMQHTVRWNRPEKEDEKLGLSTVLADCLHAVIGAIYQEQGMEAARRFVHDFVLARDMDLRSLIQLDEPKRQLTALLRQAGKPRAESRILSETGRLSSAPVYVVGVFSKDEKLAEGFGSSIKMAEFRVSWIPFFFCIQTESLLIGLPKCFNKSLWPRTKRFYITFRCRQGRKIHSSTIRYFSSSYLEI